MRIKQALLNNQWVKAEVKKYLKKNLNGNTTCQHLWDVVKAVFSGKFIGINTYEKKNNL